MSPSHKRKATEATQGPNRAFTAYLVEIRHLNRPFVADSKKLLVSLNVPGITLDEEYEPVEMAETRGPQGIVTESSAILRILVRSKKDLTKLEQHPEVIKIWPDTPIGPFS
jgi:hypothetical protein